MYHLNHVYAYGPVTRRAFMLLRGHHHHPSIPTAVSPSHRESVPTPPLQVPGNQHSAVCLCEFTALGTSSKWGQKVFVRAIWLMSLSAMSSRVTCVALHQSFTLFEGCLSFHCESVAMFLPSGCFRPQQLRDGEKESPGRAHCPPPLLSSWVPGQRVQTLFSRLCYFCWDGSSFSQDRLELLPVQYPWMLLVVRQESVSCPSRNVLHYQVSQIGKTKRTKARAFPSALSESARLL